MKRESLTAGIDRLDSIRLLVVLYVEMKTIEFVDSYMTCHSISYMLEIPSLVY